MIAIVDYGVGNLFSLYSSLLILFSYFCKLAEFKISCTSWSYEIPMHLDCAGKSLKSVIPGLVFISSTYGTELTTKKSTRESELHPQARWAFIAISFILFVISGENSAGKINSVIPSVYLAS